MHPHSQCAGGSTRGSLEYLCLVGASRAMKHEFSRMGMLLRVGGLVQCASAQHANVQKALAKQYHA